MATYGESSSLIKQFPIFQVKEIVQLILQSWQTFTTTLKFEDKITNKFYAHLIENKDRSKCFFAIEARPAEIDELGNEIGEIDLKFIYQNQEKVYFSFECKRLRVNSSRRFYTLAGKYVTEGMYRCNGW